MFICFPWQRPMGGKDETDVFKIWVLFLPLERRGQWSELQSVLKTPCSPTHPPTHPLQRQEARHGQLVPWTDTGAESVGGGGPRIITGFSGIRRCLTQAVVLKTALYGKLMMRQNNCKGHCCSLGSPHSSERGLLPSPGAVLSRGTEIVCPHFLHSGEIFLIAIEHLFFNLSLLNLIHSEDLDLCSSVGMTFRWILRHEKVLTIVGSWNKTCVSLQSGKWDLLQCMLDQKLGLVGT